MGTITGDASNNVIAGTDYDDAIYSKEGDDEINGKRGNDNLYGDLGDDTYKFSGSLFGSDEVIESAGSGNDTIHILSDIPASVVRLVGGHTTGSGKITDSIWIIADGYGSVRLRDHLIDAQVEWLQVGDGTPISLTGGLAMTGDSTSEKIKGTKFNDTINGAGGNDYLYGGLGDDIYIINNNGVTIYENLPEGNDTVNSTISFTLSANLETLNLMGTEAINGVGNDLNNNLTGNVADNKLDGGIGKDNMAGGLGNDTYYIDDTEDIVIENLSEGTDTVRSSIAYTLLPDFEDLVLTGTSAINGTGNLLNNSLIGNSASNRLDGGGGDDILDGGAGNDILQAGFGEDNLTGGAGSDDFVFYAPGDFIIQDFQKYSDLLKFDSATTELHDIESLLQVITYVDDVPEGVSIHFVSDVASITLIGMHSSNLSADMVDFV